ncbi:hypothetical protein V6O07_10900 [Arthrospira platensis SPKY2]
MAAKATTTGVVANPKSKSEGKRGVFGAIGSETGVSSAEDICNLPQQLVKLTMPEDVIRGNLPVREAAELC